MREPIFEICVEGVEEMLDAMEAGARRVELCSALSEGGLTPSVGLVETALAAAGKGCEVFVMIRPRGGDFLYTDYEFQAMLSDIARFKAVGVPGIVAGCLLPDGRIDEARMTAIVDAARPMSVTCHRAFDMTNDPAQALEALIRSGVSRILTTGQHPTAAAGCEVLRRMIALSRNRITIMVCGDVEAKRLVEYGRPAPCIDYHFDAATTTDSPMIFRNPAVSMGGEEMEREYRRRTLDLPAARERIDRLRTGWQIASKI